jgi:GT2 family glycosyltransferase
MYSPSVSVLILNWNGLALLQQCLPSVVASTYPNLEIVVADNASTDESVAWVQAHYPDVRIIQHLENGGYSKGNNQGIEQTEGDYVLLLNNDVEVTPSWIEPLVALMEAQTDVAAVQPKLLQYQDRSLFEYAGASGGFLDRYGYAFTRGRLFFTLEPDAGQYDDTRDVFWATGAAILLRRKALAEVSLLDEQFFMHFEEIDLCWRLQRHGWRIMVEPKSVVYHIGGASLPQGNPRKTYFNFRNSLLMLYKNLPPSAFRRIMFGRIVFDAIAWLRALFGGTKGEAKAIFHAYQDFWEMRRLYLRPVPTEKQVLPTFPKSIVLSYFLRNKKKFSDLDWD